MKPTDELKNEHEAIKLMLRILEAVSKKLESGGKVDAKHLESMVEFIQVFADKCHHAKEEGLLFPAMERAGIPRERGPIGVMLLEHTEGRDFVKGMKEAAAEYRKGDPQAGVEFAEQAMNYANLLSNHIGKEDNILYPMADARLTAAAQQDLEKDFEKIEKEVIGPGRHEAFHKLLHHLEEEFLKKP
jgi:hemerythrin-like domain-containing protein